MTNASFVESCLNACVENGFLTRLAARRAEELCAHGLHLEQALLGTGLLSREEYGSVVEKILALPMSSLPLPSDFCAPKGFTQEDASNLRVWPLEKKGRVWRVGYAEAWNEEAHKEMESRAKEHAWEIEPVVILFSDWRRVAQERVSEEPSVRSSQEEHPRAWMQNVHAFFAHPDGALVFVGASEAFHEAKNEWLAAQTEEDREEAEACLSSTEEGTELALHRTLAGMPTLACAKKADAWEALRGTSIPIRIIRSTRFPKNVHAWESWTV